MVVEGLSWDASVYDGIRQFHKAKGFDAYSQEVALELGDSLFQLSCDRKALFSHMQENDPADCHSDSDGDSYTEEGSEPRDEGYDFVRFELGDDSPIQEQNIDCLFCVAMDHTSRHDDILTADEGPSAVLDESDASGSQCSAHEEAEPLAPSWSLNIIMTIQFVLILTATALSLYDYF
ncbi:hypothetical protein B0H13DRAFT_2512498 [Mycena leptocephala]|nr:hypothetical protein B0H13DRAFT_2512498 [Mycena leptocephala]